MSLFFYINLYQKLFYLMAILISVLTACTSLKYIISRDKRDLQLI